MRVASVTMVGQFPDGIDLHARNLRWALSEEDHSFIVTPAYIVSEFGLKNSGRTTYIPFDIKEKQNGFINFWREFPHILKEYAIEPEWFLFTESDILFFARPPISDDPGKIRSYLPQGSYRNILVGDKILHPRVWEGSQLVHGDIVRRAIKFGIDFSFVSRTFLDEDRAKYEEEFGGPITMSMYKAPDTMDEFGLYCALVEKTQIENVVKALHMRGPESLHRQFPDIYRYATKERLAEVQKKMPYLDILLAVALYYTAGTWNEIEHLDWTKAKAESKREIDRLLITGMEWMNFSEYTKLDSLRLLMGGYPKHGQKIPRRRQG